MAIPQSIKGKVKKNNRNNSIGFFLTPSQKCECNLIKLALSFFQNLLAS